MLTFIGSTGLDFRHGFRFAVDAAKKPIRPRFAHFAHRREVHPTPRYRRRARHQYSDVRFSSVVQSPLMPPSSLTVVGRNVGDDRLRPAVAFQGITHRDEAGSEELQAIMGEKVRRLLLFKRFPLMYAAAASPSALPVRYPCGAFNSEKPAGGGTIVPDIRAGPDDLPEASADGCGVHGCGDHGSDLGGKK